ncbi:uncharacterized protein [Lolium perenne]|uniref:uncharacterized protein isoform X2 n=1 Tax=Lolium perenne TaxID=4522 RepID=UPI0021F65168|nr:uncharacterized protein LOC127332393 isoform X2 [Lolium perenne]
MGGFARRGMAETPGDPLRFGHERSIEVMRYTDCPVMLSVVPDTLGGSSTGWTDEKHMLYISSLELSFVTKLYDGEVNSNGVLCWSSSEWRHKNHNGNHRNIEVDQVYSRMVEADAAESRLSQAEHTPSYDEDQDDRKAYYMDDDDDDASTSDPRQEGISYYARRKNFGGSCTSHLHWHGHSLSGTDLSDQNFVDNETEVSEEQRRVCSNKRLKLAADTTSSPAAPSAIHHVEIDYSGNSSDFDIRLLNTEPASRKSHGSRDGLSKGFRLE